ncbi:MAG TPA: phosphatidylcholine/phosphatidylserine synthase, partial [Anaerolineae bacterium]|nr:phosphatidylcholine/phosphatidylserine synthase [Anaerolineae bacterium]
MSFMQSENVTRREKALAWSVHIYTASGALWGLLAVLAAVEGKMMASFAWMCVTLLVDGVDGTLARRFRVKDVVPTFDGALLDNMVDYFTYVLVPLIVVYMAEMVPAHLLIATITFVSLSSAYQF